MNKVNLFFDAALTKHAPDVPFEMLQEETLVLIADETLIPLAEKKATTTRFPELPTVFFDYDFVWIEFRKSFAEHERQRLLPGMSGGTGVMGQYYDLENLALRETLEQSWRQRYRIPGIPNQATDALVFKVFGEKRLQDKTFDPAGAEFGVGLLLFDAEGEPFGDGYFGVIPPPESEIDRQSFLRSRPMMGDFVIQRVQYFIAMLELLDNNHLSFEEVLESSRGTPYFHLLPTESQKKYVEYSEKIAGLSKTKVELGHETNLLPGEIPRALGHFRRASTLFSTIWSKAQTLRNEYSAKFPELARVVFLPADSGINLLQQLRSVPKYGDTLRLPTQDERLTNSLSLRGTPWLRRADKVDIEVQDEAAALVGLAAWRWTKGIYRFDETLALELQKTEIRGQLPIQLMERLPDYCVYIETPNMVFEEIPLHGFFAYLDIDTSGQRWVVFLLDTNLNMYGDILKPRFVPLGVTIEEGAFLEPDLDFLPLEVNAVAELSPLISMLMYLTSDQPDVLELNPIPVSKTASNLEKPKSEPRVWEVGVRFGAALRGGLETPTAENTSGLSGVHEPIRPHMRRAHWHGVWTGPRSDLSKRQLSLRWFPPIPVNWNPDAEDDQMPAVIHQVND